MEELLKSGNNVVHDVREDISHDRGDLYAMCGSLVERYKRENLLFHLHLLFGAEQNVANLCAVIGVSDKHFKVGGAVNGNSSWSSPAKSSEQHPAVLVDVAEMVQDMEDASFPELPVMVRLQSLDFCNRIFGDPIKPPLSKFHFESFGCAANGESVFYGGVIVRSDNEFPHQIVERGAEVLQGVPNDERQPERDWNLGAKFNKQDIRIRLWLSHHFTRIAAEIPNSLFIQTLSVFYCPDDFAPDALRNNLGDGHEQSFAAGVRLSA